MLTYITTLNALRPQCALSQPPINDGTALQQVSTLLHRESTDKYFLLFYEDGLLCGVDQIRQYAIYITAFLHPKAIQYVAQFVLLYFMHFIYTSQLYHHNPIIMWHTCTVNNLHTNNLCGLSNYKFILDISKHLFYNAHTFSSSSPDRC